MRVDEVIRSAIDRAGVIRVRNAMNPLLWLSPISATICWVAAYMFRDDPILKYSFAGLGGLPIVAALGAYFLYFLLDRDRLQSEEFVLKQRELSIIERKGLPPVPFDGEEAEDIQIIDATEKGSYSVSCWSAFLRLRLRGTVVLAGLVPAIPRRAAPKTSRTSPRPARKAHKNKGFRLCSPRFWPFDALKTWMAGTSPAMTPRDAAVYLWTNS